MTRAISFRTFVQKTLLFIGLSFLALVVLVPLLIMFFGSFKNPLEVTSFNLEPPKVWLFSNYAQVVQDGDLIRVFFNSIFITTASVTLTIFASSIASFIIARRQSRLTNFLYYFFFFGLLAPMQIIPTFSIFQALQIYGTYLNIIILYFTLNISFSCFVYVGFIKGIPRALDEAAMLEGATFFRMFFVILFPLLKPVSVTIGILIFLSVWNDINLPLYFLSDPSMWTMPLSVYRFFGRYQADWNLVFAVLMLTSVPVVILYLFGQRFIVSGLTAGGVK
jgi:raffinose/stachyose/melibiose transport system permease protein